MQKMMEMQGFDIAPDDVEDEIYVRGKHGELEKVAVTDDAENH